MTPVSVIQRVHETGSGYIWVNETYNGWMDGWMMDGWMMDGWMDG